ncbi:MAG: PAS domain-containing sensor histidine kinase [Pyrinomonadaceae bacterium]|nr:PAS domain-containing sensor histidine kinase [Pyrinomonadaceae bacterium]
MLMEQASDGIHTYDMQGNILDVNFSLCEMLGYSREELLLLNIRDLVSAEELARFPIRFDDLGAGRKIISERRLRRKDGTFTPVEISGNILGDGVLQAIVRDVSERKRAEEAIRRAHDELERRVEERTAELARTSEELRAEIIERKRIEETLRKNEEARNELLRQLGAAQEQERWRIARELHDQMGQRLSALMLGLKSLTISSGQQPAVEQLGQLIEITNQLVEGVHTLAWELRPLVLDDLGLITALRTYLDEWANRAKIPVGFFDQGLADRLPADIETTLYRVVQESLTNILKHADAKGVSVILEQRENNVSLIIEDDGKGFDVPNVWCAPLKDRGLGLLGMRERVMLGGGSLNVESTPGVGTTIFVRFALAK